MMNKTVLILLVSMIWTQTGYAYLYEDSLSNHSYKKAVHELLSPNEIFIQFRDVYTTGIYEYVAIVVDPNADNPVVTYLFKSESLHSYARENCTNKDLGQLVWSPLQPLLQGKSTIYFSASGELYNYPIEYLRCPEDTDKQMNEVYKMYRLSGIEQLARQEINASEQKKAVVFGGLEYDLNADTNDNPESKLLAFRGNVSGLSTLPETRKEVAYIDSILRKENILVSLQTGNRGGKSAFNEVTQSNATMLHLATHGFYNPQHYLTNESRLKKWMMSRTGICLAGDYYNTDIEYNGLMTGRDISSMDMENLDLVVLSACQTGLGDVFEGKQYGLSNAFKDAKAKSILASLWSVHDDATKLLMIRFYSNLIKGLEKCEALKEAQSFVRNYSVESKASGKGRNSAEREKSGAYDAGRKPYQSPIYWASFVMIDANKPLQTTVSKETLDFINQFKSENMLGSFVDEDIDNWEKYKEFLKPEDALIYFYNYTLPSGVDEYVALIYTPERTEGMLVPVIRSKEKNPDWKLWET
ncbi:MAG: CHAT domain-containing protein, partial [Porphyromonadaceae bacterium]|nr:CHAT domain-containing protein [Porphyromonadaceae bacterium]